jgi:hypothetical protein
MKSLEPYKIVLPSNIFPILSVEKFARLLGVPRETLEKVAESFANFYEPFPKKTGKKPRTIDNPVEPLKSIQQKINKFVFQAIKFPNFIIGGVKGRNPLEHPMLHINKPVVVTIDVKDCYPRISNSCIFNIWHKQLQCSHDVAHLATKLTTRAGHLPLGAPTSNFLANIALFPCVSKTITLAEKDGFVGSQYIDDSAFSGKNLNDSLITEIIQEFSRQGFKIGRKKVHVMRGSGVQSVTGKTVNKKLNSSREGKDKVRAALHELSTTMNQEDKGYSHAYNSVKGRINHLKQLHCAGAEKMYKQLESLPKPKS